MIKEKLYNYSEIENANFNFDLCTEKEHFLQALRISEPVKVKNFNTKGTNYSLEYDNVASQFTLCINKAELITTDYVNFSLMTFMEFLTNLAYYDNKSLMCSFHDEGQYSVLLTIPCDKNSLRIAIFNKPIYSQYNCSTDIIIKKDNFLIQIRKILEKAVKDTKKLDHGNENRYVDCIIAELKILEEYFNNPNEFKKTYIVQKYFRVFDIAYKNLNGIWEFYVCLDDDKKADLNYWEKLKQDNQIIDYDYYEQNPIDCYFLDRTNKNFIHITREEIRKSINTNMDERIEDRNWVYSTETKNWYSDNEIMPAPKEPSKHIYTNLNYEIKINTEYFSYSEEELLKEYIEEDYDLPCVFTLKNDSHTVCNIEFNYNNNQEIREALNKAKEGKYVRFNFDEYSDEKIHFWKQTFPNDNNDYITIACYSRPDEYRPIKQLYYFTAGKDFIECFINALNDIENKINVMKKTLNI